MVSASKPGQSLSRFPGPILRLIPFIAWATSLGHSRAGPTQGLQKPYSCCSREQPSHLKPSIPRIDAGHLQYACRRLWVSCPFGIKASGLPSSASVTAGDDLRNCPLYPGGLNRSTQHFILEGKDGVWDGTKIS